MSEYSYAAGTNNMQTFQINTLIQVFKFFTSYAWFEPHEFILRMVRSM